MNFNKAGRDQFKKWACKHKSRKKSIGKAQAHRDTLWDKDEVSATCARQHTPRHTRTLKHTFTLCLCGLSEPAKLSLLLLSEVSQRDPLVLPTCSSHSQTAEEAVSQYTAERERGMYKRQLHYKLLTRLPCPAELLNKYMSNVYSTMRSSVSYWLATESIRLVLLKYKSSFLFASSMKSDSQITGKTEG